MLLLALALLAGFAWLTRHPETPFLDRAAEWPLVGGLARGFAERYRSPPTAEPGPDSGGRDALEVVVLPADEPEWIGARPQIWVQDGTVLRTEPRADAPIVLTVHAIANLSLIERSGDWFDLWYRGRRGWAHLPDHEAPTTPPMGSDPIPLGPVEARLPDAGRLRQALDLLGSGRREIRLGPYVLHTDATDPAGSEQLRPILAILEDFYADRYGLRPIGEPAEAIVLYAEESDFRAFQSGDRQLAGIESAGLASAGIVATFAGDREPAEISSTLVHEIGHLLNRRALGPALPAWLDEGLAGDLGHCVQEGGGLDPERLGGVAINTGGRWEWRGGLAAAIQLRRAVNEGRLPRLDDLLALDWEDFVTAADSTLHYAQSALWMRHLLEESESAGRLRGFLAEVAAGGAVDSDALAASLGTEWAELDSAFRIWVKLRFHEPLEVVLDGG